MRRYKYAIVIGRFQPVHKGHIKLFKEATDIADNLVIVVGSAGKPPTPKNPFTDEFREIMLYGATNDISNEIYVIHARDYMYNDQKWVTEVQSKINGWVSPNTDKSEIVLVGHDKDESSWYLNMFPQYHYKEVGSDCEIHATDIRENIYRGQHEKNRDIITERTFDFIDGLIADGHFDRVIKEWKFNNEYKESVSQYPRIEQTCDAVVVQSGHILLIQRKYDPGKYLWALPGGFVGQKEKVLQSCIRELNEETSIDVPVKTLYANLKDHQGIRFDHPDRDSRGRIITTAFLIHLPDIGRFTKVKANDDAMDCRWVPISWVRDNTDQIYADHYEIIERMIGDI